MILEGLEGRKLAVGVLLNLYKAFDCVDQQILLTGLETYGIRDLPLQWLGSYLSHITQLVNITDTLSSPINLSNEIPQGSILCPLLYFLFTQ